MNETEEEYKGRVSKTVQRNQKQKVAWQIVKVNENKVTFVMYKLRAYEDLGDSDKINITTEGQVGDNMVLKVDKTCIDKVIDNYGDIVAKIEHIEGVVIDVITFEEL